MRCSRLDAYICFSLFDGSSQRSPKEAINTNSSILAKISMSYPKQRLITYFEKLFEKHNNLLPAILRLEQ
jgi:uncharacterized FAD-dependent dehydrogenase